MKLPEFPDDQSDLQPDRVDVDPDLFGEWPDGPIEIVDEADTAMVSGKQVHEWERERVLIELIDACPHCDGSVSEQHMTNVTGDTVVRWTCDDCDEKWVTNRDKDFTGAV